MKCLIYKSTPSKELKDRALRTMLVNAKKFNRENDVTGCIFINHEKVIQLIEGEKNTIDQLYNRILKDTRHQQIETLLEKEIYTRSMQDWSMAVYNLEGNSDDADFSKLSLLEQLYKSPNIDIIETINSII